MPKTTRTTLSTGPKKKEVTFDVQLVPAGDSLEDLLKKAFKGYTVKRNATLSGGEAIMHTAWWHLGIALDGLEALRRSAPTAKKAQFAKVIDQVVAVRNTLFVSGKHNKYTIKKAPVKKAAKKAVKK